MKWHDYYAFVMAGVLVVAVLAYSLFGGQTAIVAAHVTATRLQGSNWVCSGPWLWMAQSDQAFHKTLFSTCAKCDIPVGSQIAIGVATNWTNEPLRANATLYKAQGVGFVSWDGC